MGHFVLSRLFSLKDQSKEGAKGMSPFSFKPHAPNQTILPTFFYTFFLSSKIKAMTQVTSHPPF